MNKKEEAQRIIDNASFMLMNNETTFKDIFYSFTSREESDIALLSQSIKEGIVQFTYREYKEIVKGTSARLSNLLKGERNKVVGLKVKNSPFWCIAFYAILMLGYKPLLIDAKLAKDNTNNLLKSAKAIAIISDDNEKYDVLSINKKEIYDTNKDPNFKEDWEDEVIFCSSGTTGNIKLVIFNGLNMVNQLNASKEMPKENIDIIYSKIDGPTNIVALIPLHHIFAFVAIFLWYTFYNKTLIFIDSNDPKILIDCIKSLRVTHIYHVPLFYEVVMKNFYRHVDEKSKAKIDKLIEKTNENKKVLFHKKITERVQSYVFGPQIRYLISGGGALSKEVSSFFNGIGYKLHNGFGMTEVGVTSVELSSNVVDRLKLSIGHPLYSVDYKLGEKDELLIKSPTIHKKEIVSGEIKDTVLDNEGYFHTGDIARKDDDNRFYLLGRLKDTIITSNGENVYPDEIESYFKNIDGVNNLVVFASNNKIVMIIMGNESLREKCEEINKSLPIHKQVNEMIFILEALPLSSSGKVKRFLVKENYEKNAYQKVKKEVIDILKGYDETKKKEVVSRLEKVFQNVLMVKEPIEGNAHWINDLHSDSMTYITLVGEIEKEFKIEIPLEKYGKLTTLNEFAKEILDFICK